MGRCTIFLYGVLHGSSVEDTIALLVIAIPSAHITRDEHRFADMREAALGFPFGEQPYRQIHRLLTSVNTNFGHDLRCFRTAETNCFVTWVPRRAGNLPRIHICANEALNIVWAIVEKPNVFLRDINLQRLQPIDDALRRELLRTIYTTCHQGTLHGPIFAILSGIPVSGGPGPIRRHEFATDI
jgi:hypothetical protein